MSEPLIPDVSLGVAALDAEHSLQVTLLRALKDACGRGDQQQSLELIDQLDDYTNMHFLFEETLMIQSGYPGHESHHQEHEHLIGELRSLRQAVTDSANEESLSAADAIERWLLRHIQSFDRAFAAYIAPSSDH